MCLLFVRVLEIFGLLFIATSGHTAYDSLHLFPRHNLDMGRHLCRGQRRPPEGMVSGSGRASEGGQGCHRAALHGL